MKQIDQSIILAAIVSLKSKYDKKGIVLEGLFGSYAKNSYRMITAISISPIVLTIHFVMCITPTGSPSSKRWKTSKTSYRKNCIEKLISSRSNQATKP